MDEIFGEDNFKNEIITGKSNRIKTEGTKFPSWFDNIFLFSRSLEKAYFFHLYEKRNERGWRQIDNKGESWSKIPKDIIHLFSKGNIKYDSNGNAISRSRIILGKEFLPPNGRRFPSQDQIFEMEKRGEIRIGETGYPHMLKSEKIYLTDNWTDIFGYDSNWSFPTENSEILLKRVIESTSYEGDLVLDFFLGSGTTTAVAHKLGRRWIGVEMGDHFYTVILPRMKKVLAYDKSGISKEVKDYHGGGFFKYYELEQYEEALANCKYEDGDLFTSPSKTPYQEYIFMKDEKMLSALEIDYENNRVNVDLSRLYLDIDIAETLSNLTGKWIKKIKDGEVEFEDGSKISTKNLDYKLIKPLIWWE
jgi:adenine specific DNA methylase Mod